MTAENEAAKAPTFDDSIEPTRTAAGAEKRHDPAERGRDPAEEPKA